MLKIGMIGAGFVAGFHERALCSVRGVEFAGVCAPEGAEAIAERARKDGLGKTKVFERVADLCKAVDVVCIFAPNYSRIDIMRGIARAIEGGAKIKGIICEKPLARNLQEADVITRMAKALHVPTAYFENQLHMPSIVEARRQLEAV
ncbi:MAG: Gfo/Idh/MocA family oxidoreductase, partial [Phycisphaerales bacterium]